MQSPITMTWAKPVLFALLCAVVFFILRMMALDMAVDQLAPVDEAVYQIVYKAIHFEELGGPSFKFIHLWGQAYLVPILRVLIRFTDNDTLAVHLLVVAIHATGFFFTLLLLLRWAGWAPASALALLFLFPDPVFFFWSVILYGAYPEAYSLMALPIFIWTAGLQRETGGRRWLLAGGVAAGAVMCFSPSVLFIACTMVLLMPWIRGFTDWLKPTIILATGMVIGLLPFLYWFFTVGRTLTFTEDYQGKLPGNTLMSMFSLPSADKISYLIGLWNLKGTSEGWPIRALFLFAIVGIAASVLLRKEKENRWKMLYPASLVVSLVVISFFLDVQMLQTHHVLWFFYVQYICLALFVGGPLLPDAWYGVARPGFLRTAEILIKATMLILVLVFHLSPLSYLVQPGNRGMLSRYRGTDYFEMKIGSLIGPEVSRVNRLMDQNPSLLNELDFQQGFRRLFPMVGIYSCCLKESLRPDWSDLAPNEEIHDLSSYYRGIGCAYALKAESRHDQLASLAPELYDSAREGYDLCLPFR